MGLTPHLPRVPPAGIWCPAITLFDPVTDTIDLDAQRKFYRYLANSGLTGLVILGTNAETFLLTRDERKTLIALAREVVGPDFPIMAGCGMHSTKQTLEFAADAKAAGANYLLVLTAAYFGKQTSMTIVKRFFVDVATKVELPVLMYNFPAVTNGIDVDSETMTEVVREAAAAAVASNQSNGAAAESNVVGVKLTCASVGKINRLAATFGPDEFAIFGGQSDFLISGRVAGSAGCIAAFANVFPKTIVKIDKLWKEGKTEEALALQRRVALAETPTKSGIATTKYAALLYTAEKAGIEVSKKADRFKPRTPYEEPSDAAKANVKKVMADIAEIENNL